MLSIYVDINCQTMTSCYCGWCNST